MTGALVTVKIDDREMQELFSRILENMDDMTPVMRDIGEVVVESVTRNFEQHRSPDGTPWKPLAESTKRQRARLGRNPEDILILNRILMGSIHAEAGPLSVEIGSDVVYAAIHQLGGKAGRGHSVDIEARQFLGIRDEDWPEIKSSVLDYIITGK